MTLEISSSAQLSFQHNDEVLLTHVDNGKRRWTNGHEKFSRAVFHDDHIEFRQLTDDGDDLEDTAEIRKKYRDIYFRSLGDIAYNGAVYFWGAEKWTWNTTGVPLPETLNIFRQENLTSAGANNFPLRLMEGSGENDEFSLPDIMRSLAEGTLPISTDPGYFLHDMRDHSVGMMAIDKNCMSAISSFAQLSVTLRDTHPRESEDLALYIASNLDFYSFFRNFATKMATSPIDPLLSNVLTSSTNFSKKHTAHMKSILISNGYIVANGRDVLRNDQIQHYYAYSLAALNPTVSTDKN